MLWAMKWYTEHMRLGIALFVLGSIFLLYNLGLLEAAQVSILWPALLIVAGVALIVKPAYRCGRCGKSSWMNNPRCAECKKKWCGKAECDGCDVCNVQ